MNARNLLNWVVPSREECRRAAADLRLKDPNRPAVQVARLAVKSARRWGASIGAMTGAAGPITMLPAAFAEAAALLRMEGHMAGTIAALLDPASLDEEDRFRRDILRVIFPGAVSQALRTVGVRAGENVTKQILEKYVTQRVLKEINERAVKWLGTRITQKAIATKAAPIVGAGIGAAWNYVELQAIGTRAIHYHLGSRPPSSPLREKLAKWVRHSRNHRNGKKL